MYGFNQINILNKMISDLTKKLLTINKLKNVGDATLGKIIKIMKEEDTFRQLLSVMILKSYHFYKGIRRYMKFLEI